MRSLRASAALGAAMLLVACYRGPGVESSTFEHPYPDGVLAASPAPSPTGMYERGFYGGYNCCWITADTAFATFIEGGRKHLRIMVSLPANGPYDTRPQVVTVRVEDTSKTFGNLRAGIYALDVPVTQRSSDRQALVRVHSRYGWTPPGDTHMLSVQLRSVHTF